MMKKVNLQGLGAIAITGLVLSSCGGLGKMKKKVGELEFTVNPNPMEVHGDSVAISISTNIPAKYFGKKVVAEATPTIVTESGEEFSFEPAVYQGEKAAGNGQVVKYKEGGKLSYEDVISYQDAMEVSELRMNYHGAQGNKEADFQSTEKIAEGMIITSKRVVNDDMTLLGNDQFQRITNHEQNAEINYLINSPQVRSSELRDQDMKDLDGFVKEGNANDRITYQQLYVSAYASPDGEMTKNDELANQRAESGAKAAKNILKKNKSKEADSAAFFVTEGKGEDWDGFKSLMQESDIEDKNIIIRVLEQYNDPAKREEEIKNIAETYEVIKDDILPSLRRSQIYLKYELFSYTDEELKAISKSKPDSLNVEQLLFAATLFEDLNDKLEIYKSAESVYPTDWRGSNNVGVIMLMQNDMAGAKAQFEKSNGIMDTPESTNNLGVIARMEGDRAKATELFASAASSGKAEVSYNQGIVAIQNGQYDDAVSKMGEYNTINKGLALILAGNPQKAIETIEASDDADSAMGYYLKAVAGARMNNAELVTSNLKSAVAKDSSLKAKAERDLEFLDFRDKEAFKAIVE